MKPNPANIDGLKSSPWRPRSSTTLVRSGEAATEKKKKEVVKVGYARLRLVLTQVQPKYEKAQLGLYINLTKKLSSLLRAAIFSTWIELP